MSKSAGLAPCFFFVCATLFVGSSQGIALEPTIEEDSRNRINLASRQAALIQEMTRDVCFVMAGIEPERFSEKALSAVRQFEVTLQALQVGDGNLRLLPQSNQSVVAQILAGQEIWNDLRPAVQQVASNDLHSVPMRQLLNLHLEVQDELFRSVDLIIQNTPDAALAPDMARTLARAGQQRVWSQKASKAVCFLSLGIDPVRNRKSLADSLTAFEAGMVSLFDGDPDQMILAPPNSRLKRQLQRVERVWTDLAALMRAAKDNPNLDAGQRVKLANLSDHVLLEMTLAVTMYSQL
jgi:hypothetical protein